MERVITLKKVNLQLHSLSFKTITFSKSQIYLLNHNYTSILVRHKSFSLTPNLISPSEFCFVSVFVFVFLFLCTVISSTNPAQS